MLRKSTLALAGAGLLAGPFCAFAQPIPQYSVDDLVCRYEGSCPADASQVEAKEGDEVAAIGDSRGFNIAKRKQPVAGSPNRSSLVRARPANRQRHRIGVSNNDLLVTFQNDSSELTEQAKVNISVFAQALKSPQLASKRFEIAGHTDAVGPAQYNLQLSQRRAETVAAYLEAERISRARLKVVGYGYNQPLPTRPKRSPDNRRVEATVIEGR